MPTMRELVLDLEGRRARALELGGADKVEAQHARGKLTCRERIGRLFDAGSFQEIGIHATHHNADRSPYAGRAPADGVVTGTGFLDGRPVALAAYDFTVMGGSIGEVGEVKVTRLREIALRQRLPIVWLIDSAGARIHKDAGFHLQASLFAGTGYLFREQVHLSGVVPQVAAMVGPGAAGTAYIPGLADFVPMVKGTSSMALGGPPLVKAAVGEDISEEDLGGSQVHTRVSGCADLEVATDDECLAAIRAYLSFFPSHCGERPPVVAWDAASEPSRLPDAVLDLIPENPKRAYDVKRVIEALVDGGATFELKPGFARNLVTCLARMGGHPVGVVANNPKFLGGALDVDASDKAARFVNLCDAFQIPLVFLQDVPGFIVGSKVEQQGIIRHGAKMLHAVADATVPKLTVILRKAYGAGYYVMCGRAYEPDLIVAWPTAEISVMGPEGMVAIFARKMLAALDDPAQRDPMKQVMVDEIRKNINPYLAAGHALVDDVIDPRDTRRVLLHALRLTRNKTVERPAKRRGVVPV